MTLTEFLLARIAEAEDELSPRDEFNRWAWVECESKQRIVELCKPDPSMPVDSGRYVAAGVLALLAVPYADHPDYRDEWRP